MDPVLEITLMRHGRSRADDESVHEGRYDSPLTEVGKTQAARRGEALQAAGAQFDCIIASTLQRAHESARILGQILGVAVETDPDWMEFNNGPLGGLTLEEANRLYPIPNFRNLYEPFHGSGESEWEFHSRAARAVQSVVRRGAGRYLVVAHGGILNMALRVIVGTPPVVMGQGIWFAFEDLGYARLNYYPTRHVWVLRELVPGFTYPP